MSHLVTTLTKSTDSGYGRRGEPTGKSDTISQIRPIMCPLLCENLSPYILPRTWRFSILLYQSCNCHILFRTFQTCSSISRSYPCLNGHTLGALSMFCPSSNFKCSSSIKLFSCKKIWTLLLILHVIELLKLWILYVEPRHCQEMIHCLFGTSLSCCPLMSDSTHIFP